MKRFLVTVLFLVFFALSFKISPVFADVNCEVERCATCDQCGYCRNYNPPPPARNPPSNWKSCQQCLYPELGDVEAESNESLRIASNGLPLAPKKGAWYTMIGCIETNLGSFTEKGAAGNVVQKLLNLLFSTAGGIAFLYILYGAFLILTSQANPERLSQGKQTVYGAIVGLIFALSSIFVVNLIGSGILRLPGFGN